MQIKKHAASIIALFLEICILNTSALTRERKFVHDSQFDKHSCASGDTAKTFGHISSKFACIASCVEIKCRDVFYFPGTNMCQACYTSHSDELKPAASSEMTFYYKPVLECLGSYVRYNNSCYLVTDTKMTWDDAKIYCESVNAHLAIIENVDENSFIGTYLESKGVGSLDTRIFFGLTDLQEENNWLTVHGDNQSFLHWTPGQPNIPDINEDCAAINMVETLKTWNDMPCSEQHLAVCEMELI